jgi:regulator of replication initiation timing
MAVHTSALREILSKQHLDEEKKNAQTKHSRRGDMQQSEDCLHDNGVHACIVVVGWRCSHACMFFFVCVHVYEKN